MASTGIAAPERLAAALGNPATKSGIYSLPSDQQLAYYNQLLGQINVAPVTADYSGIDSGDGQLGERLALQAAADKTHQLKLQQLQQQLSPQDYQNYMDLLQQDGSNAGHSLTNQALLSMATIGIGGGLYGTYGAGVDAGAGGGIDAGMGVGGSDAAAGIDGGTNLFANGATAPNYAAGDTWGAVAGSGSSAPASTGLFGSGFTGQQAAGGAASLAAAGGGGGDSANTGSDAHFYQSQGGGTGVQDLGNMGGTGTATIPSWAYQTPGLVDAIKAGGSAIQQWAQANPSLAAGLGSAALGSLTGGSSNLNMPNFNGAAQSQQRSGMVNQTTPWGSSTYTQTGVDAQGNPIYSQNTTLNAQGQANLNSAQAAQGTALNNIYGGSADQAKAIQQAQQASYNKATTMLDPQWSQSKQALDSSLANQGIGIGSEAYNNANLNYNNAKTTAYGQAQDQAILTGNNLQNQLFGQNLQAANTLGNSVQNPTFSQQPAAANYLGAAGLQGQGNINQYNATTGANNSLTNGLFNLGGSLLGNSNFTSGVGNLFGSLFGSGTQPTQATSP